MKSSTHVAACDSQYSGGYNGNFDTIGDLPGAIAYAAHCIRVNGDDPWAL
jgi:hypothetical protein